MRYRADGFNSSTYVLDFTPGVSGTTFVSFMHATSAHVNMFHSDATWLRLRTGASAELSIVGQWNGLYSLQVNGGATSVFSAPEDGPGIVVKFDIEYTEDTGSGVSEGKVYINDALVATAVGGEAGTTPDNFVFYGHGLKDSTVDLPWGAVSCFVIKDGVSTVGKRFAELRANTIGHYGQWDGTLVGTYDAHGGTGLSTTSANQRTSFSLGGATGLTTFSSVDAVHCQIKASRSSATAPGIIRPFYRTGGVDYDNGSAVTLSSDGATTNEIITYTLE